ncbi:MAG TPA: hypothetical protein VGR71_12120 [Nitrospira sp.]|nr:hypothetical protein [Nitrospira sp.]
MLPNDLRQWHCKKLEERTTAILEALTPDQETKSTEKLRKRTGQFRHIGPEMIWTGLLLTIGLLGLALGLAAIAGAKVH